MAITTPKMALRAWNQTQDTYDHDQLTDNWFKLDYHDHTPGRGVQIPTEGIADGAITAAKLAPGANSLQQGQVGLYNLGSDVTTDYGYAFTTYKRLYSGGLNVTPTTTVQLVLRSTAVASGAANTPSVIFYFDPANYAAGTRATYLRLRAGMATNQVAPTVNLIAALYPVAVTYGTSGNFNTWATSGGAVAGSTATVATPAVSSTNIAYSAGSAAPATGGDFVAPGAGWYGVGVSSSAAPAAGFTMGFNFVLDVRQY